MRTTVKSKRLGECYHKIDHPSGLSIYLYPMAGYNNAYALFGTKFGSIDCVYKLGEGDDWMRIPDGTAHFLEHKLFENEDGDAFLRYAKTGASANAYTSFDRTCYLFSCADPANFKASLDILLDFVTKPYFTEKTIEKEQGIIAQEIKMYEDSPDWRVFFNMLRAMYEQHPVRTDIAGTVESIAEITEPVLYHIYDSFYDLHNMALSIAGNFDVETVLEAADRILPTREQKPVIRQPIDEPQRAASTYIEEKLPVAIPLFHLGFKEQPDESADFLRGVILSEMLMETIASEATPLFRELYDENLVNTSFATEVFVGRGYFAYIFAGESRDPQEVARRIEQKLRDMQQHGVNPEDWERVRRAMYGKYVRVFSSVEAVAGLLSTSHFSGVEPYDFIDTVAEVTVEEANERLRRHFSADRKTLSVVLPS